MRSAIEIANWFIEESACPDLTHLKLQKLCFVAFGVHAADFDEWLFNDPIECWTFGPVLPTIYFALQEWGRDVITKPIELAFDGLDVNVQCDDTRAIASLKKTIKHFGHMSASDLVDFTHAPGGPWERAREKQKQDNRIKEISKHEIRFFFQGKRKSFQPRSISV